ncbi:phage tail tape measure protein [Staphylococcus simulans]
MNEKLQGLTLEMKLDSLGVREGMKGLKRELGVVNSEMKANLSAFDKAERSMDQYKTKIDGLNKKMKIQKQMFNQAENELKELNATYTKAKSRVKDVEQAYKSLTVANQKNKQALEKSNASLKESTQELKKAQNQSKRTNEQRDKAYQKLKQLRKAEEDLKNSNKASTAQLKRAREQVEKQSQKHKELVQKYKTEESQVKKLRGENKKLSDSNEKVKNTYDKTNKELQQTEKEFKDITNTIKNHNQNLAKAEKQVNNEKTALNNLQRTIDKTTSEMKQFNKEQLIANSHFTKVANHADNLSKKFGSVGQKMTDIGRSMTIGVTTPVVMGLGAAVKTSADFEAQMSRVGAIAQASGGQMKDMTAQAMELGAKTSQSASEVAKGMEELAALGFDANQVMSAMPGVISAAEASGADMATTAKVMASSINAFNLKASDSSHVADLLATAANDSAADISYMGEALKYAGTPAKALGVSLEDTSAAIEIMSNSGIEASGAGTALRASFIRLANPTGEASKQMKKMGIHLTDNKGKFVGMSNLINQFKNEMKGMTKEQKLANVSTIVGTEAASGFLALIDAGPQKIDEYSASLKNSDGASKKAADQMKNNLKGALEQLKGSFETLGIQIGRDLTPAIQAGAKGVQRFVEGFSSLPGWVRKSALGVTIFAAALGPAALGLGLLFRAVGSAAKGYADLNRKMAVNTVEAAANATANKGAAASLATTGKSVKGSTGTFSMFGNVLKTTTGKFSGLGNVLKTGTKLFGKVGIPLTILTTIFSVAYEKMDWFRKGFSNMGKLVKQVGDSMDFSWIDKAKNKMGTFWDDFKNDMAKGLQEGLLFKGIKKAFDGLDKMVSKASDTTNVFAKGVSKGTENALKSYNKLSQQSTLKLEQIKLQHGKISNEQYKQITNIYKKMGDEINKQLDKRHDQEIAGLNKIFKDTNGLTKQQEQKIIAQTQRQNTKETESIRKTQEKIQAIYKKAHNEHRSLKKAEINQIEKLQAQLDSKVVKSMSKGEIEQKAILERMKQNKTKLSIQAASSVIKESARERDKTISDAKKKYKDTVAEAIKQRDQYGTLSKDQADKVIRNAKKQYEESKDKAKKQHNAVVGEAKKQNKGVGSNIDEQTGKVKTGWQKMLDTVKKKNDEIVKDANKWNKVANKITGSSKKAHDGMNKWFGQVYNRAKNWFGKTKKAADKDWNSISSKLGSASRKGYNAVTKWFGQLPGKTSNWFKSTKKSTDDNWNKISNKISSSTKKAYNSAKKWFGSTYNNAKSNFKNTLNTTKDRFGSIARNVESKTRSVYNSAKKWFGNTYNNAKSNFKNMWNNAKSRYHEIASKAEEKSKSVYNSGKKWFGNTYTNAKSNFQNMKNKAKDRFHEIAGQAEEKAKKTYNSWKSWLDKTLGWIKNIKKDFGSAASSLGKEVANKAIDGLNGMIGGINKIAKAITDKTLIKTIPKLSTGTFDGTTLATNSDGGLRQPTLAVVNDRGQGNAPGGGTQEVIERADGTVYAPKGRDVIVPLGVGDIVHSAKDTKRYQDLGILPRFSKGSKKKKNIAELIAEGVSSVKGGAKEGVSNAAHGIKKSTEKGAEKLSELKDKGASWLGEAIGDVMDWVEKPGKLVNKVFDSLGISFGSGQHATLAIAKGAYSKLKESFIEKVKEMFEEVAGGEGDAGWLLKYDIWQRFGPYTGGLGFNGGQHYGIDFGMTPGTSIKAVAGGKVSKVWNDYGGGQSIEIDIGKGLTNWYMHLSKQLVKQGQRVGVGDLIAKSGNTGAFTAGTGHLHFQLNKYGKPQSNVLEWLKGLGTSSGGKGESYARSVIQQAQNILGGRYKGSSILQNMMKLAKRESNYDSNAVNDWDINAQRGTPSKGLFQMIQPTFASNAKSGFGNFNNPVHQAISAMQYIVRTYGWGGFPRAAAYAYANGGISTNHKIAEISEGNKTEMIIPMTKRSRAIQLTEQAMRFLGIDKGNVNVNTDTSKIENMLLQLVNEQKEEIKVLKSIASSNIEIANKDLSVNVDGRDLNRTNNKHQAINMQTQLMRR